MSLQLINYKITKIVIILLLVMKKKELMLVQEERVIQTYKQVCRILWKHFTKLNLADEMHQ